uniref:Outer-membrane lipoprotein carrier protein n=1 Tax=candidate division WOR-3 bacterium TaxID=2052148 RepID=A0A7V1EIU2_UNCW3
MKGRKMNKSLIFLLLALSITVLGQSQNLDSVINRTIARYQNLNSFYIEFSQQFCEKTSGMCQSFNGTVQFLKPNYFRMEIENPRQIYVGDSVSLWIYLPDKKRAIRQHLGAQIPFAVNPDIFLKDYNERFNAELKTDKNYEIILTPKEETEIYKKIIVFIDPQKYEINGITIYDETESENKFIFKNIELNKKISKKLFEFKPPKGTEVVEQ